MATPTTIHSHQYQHFEDLQMSSQEFYTMLSTMVIDYKFPDVTCKTVGLSEKGLFSNNREYLVISRQRYHYYVCACPFGRSFFISWWLKEDAHTAANVAEKFGKVGQAVAQGLEKKSFFEVDTEMMFLSSVNSLIKRAVEKVATDRGYRRAQIDTAS